MAQWEATLRSLLGDLAFPPTGACPPSPGRRPCGAQARTALLLEDDDADAEETAVIAARLGGVDRFD